MITRREWQGGYKTKGEAEEGRAYRRWGGRWRASSYREYRGTYTENLRKEALGRALTEFQGEAVIHGARGDFFSFFLFFVWSPSRPILRMNASVPPDHGCIIPKRWACVNDVRKENRKKRKWKSVPTVKKKGWPRMQQAWPFEFLLKGDGLGLGSCGRVNWDSRIECKRKAMKSNTDYLTSRMYIIRPMSVVGAMEGYL